MQFVHVLHRHFASKVFFPPGSVAAVSSQGKCTASLREVHGALINRILQLYDPPKHSKTVHLNENWVPLAMEKPLGIW